MITTPLFVPTIVFFSHATLSFNDILSNKKDLGIEADGLRQWVAAISDQFDLKVPFTFFVWWRVACEELLNSVVK